MDVNNWRFCVVGNIVKQHVDHEGVMRYGTKAFSGGTKVYIDDTTYGLNEGAITVIGRNRFGKIAIESVEISLIENVRSQRVYTPKVLEIMDHLECCEGWAWRGRTAADRRAVEAFAKAWNGVEKK